MLDAIRDRVTRGRFGVWAQDAIDIKSIMHVDSSGRREVRPVLLGVGEAQLTLHAPGDLAWLLAEVARLTKDRDHEADIDALKADVKRLQGELGGEQG